MFTACTESLFRSDCPYYITQRLLFWIRNRSLLRFTKLLHSSAFEFVYSDTQITYSQMGFIQYVLPSCFTETNRKSRGGPSSESNNMTHQHSEGVHISGTILYTATSPFSISSPWRWQQIKQQMAARHAAAAAQAVIETLNIKCALWKMWQYLQLLPEGLVP